MVENERSNRIIPVNDRLEEASLRTLNHAHTHTVMMQRSVSCALPMAAEEAGDASQRRVQHRMAALGGVM